MIKIDEGYVRIEGDTRQNLVDVTTLILALRKCLGKNEAHRILYNSLLTADKAEEENMEIFKDLRGEEECSNMN